MSPVACGSALLHSGIERFQYSIPERTIQAIATGAFACAYVAAFSALYAWTPQLAAAALLSWLTHRLSAARWGLLLLLGVADKIWIFWVSASSVSQRPCPTTCTSDSMQAVHVCVHSSTSDSCQCCFPRRRAAQSRTQL